MADLPERHETQPPPTQSLPSDPDATAYQPHPSHRKRREPSGASAGRFELREEVGRGGMGAVVRGHDPDLGRDVAVKVLREDLADHAASARRFVEEARIAGQLQHPGIVPVHELGHTADGRPFFAMKLVRGRTLAELLADRPQPAHDLPRFVQVFEQACQTIAYAHSKGVVHRDLKPQNIMVGAFGVVQVMDWGLGKVITHTETSPVPQSADDRGARAVSAITDPRTGDPDSHTRAGTTLGTYAYMPPEQARGEGDRVDERADVFGLGAVLCEILTGCPPYDGPLTEVRFLALLGRHEARPGCSLCPRHSAPQ